MQHVAAFQVGERVRNTSEPSVKIVAVVFRTRASADMEYGTSASTNTALFHMSAASAHLERGGKNLIGGSRGSFKGPRFSDAFRGRGRIA